MTIPFTKMQGLGNDYVYIDCTDKTILNIINSQNINILAKRLSDRHYGIGSDGLILIMPSQRADFAMRIFNADGSEAQMCGNGARCIGKYVYSHGMTHNKQITLETAAGLKHLRLHIVDNVVEHVSVNMGIPSVKHDYLIVADKKIDFVYVDMGNPHAVIFTTEPIKNIDINHLGHAIEINQYFPNGTNVEFVNILGTKKMCVRVWERGSGETMACGTGACACVAAGVSLGLTDRYCAVRLAGGELMVKYDAETNEIWQTGPAFEVFRGTLEITETPH